MKNIDMTMEQFLDIYTIDSIIEKYILEISEDDNITFLNNFIFEVLEGVIPTRNEDDDLMLDEDIKVGDIVYIMADNGYTIDYDGVDYEQFQGYDTFSSEENMSGDEFLKIYGEYFKLWLHEEIKYKITDILEEIENLVINNSIPVFRGMNIAQSENFLKKVHSDKYTELGVCWSHNKDSAEAFAYSTEDSNKVLLEAHIDTTEIDWEATIELNLSPSLGEEEKEIRLFDNGLIKLNKIYVDKTMIEFEEPLMFKGGHSFYDYNVARMLEEFKLYEDNKDNIFLKLLKETGYSSLEDFQTSLLQYDKKTKATNSLIFNSKKKIQKTNIKS